MKDYYIEATKNTPEVKLSYDSGSLLFIGRMIPFEGFTFFKPILDWIHEYIENPQEETVLKIYTDSANTTSAKALMMIFKDLNQLSKNGKKVSIIWYYEDEEDLEDWMAYQEFFQDLSFDYIKIDDDDPDF